MGYTKVIYSGNVVEVYRYQYAPKTYTWGHAPVRKKRNPLYRAKRGFKVRRWDNVQRLRKNFIRLVRSNLVGDIAPVLVTLTMWKEDDVAKGYKELTRFFAALRRDFGNDFRYIAVPEFQKRGAVHFHALVWGLPDSLVMYERDNRILQSYWFRGFVDCIPTDGSPKLAGYIAKYMQKAVQDVRLGGGRAYTCSRGVMRPVSLPFGEAYYHMEEITGGGEKLLTERHFETKWLGSCHYQLLTY